MEEEESEKRTVRIFVGGIGEAVTSDDIRRLFESLGSVQSLETIRTKGRSLAYLDFLADSKSLSKLFSKYNGCVWKGGKLKLEKAKEHYLDRLKKEWEEDAILSIEPPASDVSTHKEDLVKEKPNARRIVDPDAKPLNIYFPRLRTVKSIPFSGTGKHKYSFQNIKVGPLPVHFCDCEEHCSPFITKKEKLSMNGETEREKSEIGGINDEEINIMNAVMNKLLEKEKVSNTKHLGKKHDSFESLSVIHSNECEVDSATDDGDDDDDDLITNIATKKNKAALTGTEELERIMESQEWSNKTNIAEEEPVEAQKRSKSNSNKVKKRKSLSKSESESNGVASSTPVGKSKMQTLLDEVGSGAKPTEPEYDFGESAKVSWSQKSSWRELVGKGGNASFSASLISPKFDSADDQQNSDGSYTSSSTNDETEDMESDEYPESEPTNTKVIEEPSKSQPTDTQVIEEHGEAQATNTRVIEEPAESLPTNAQVIEEPAEAQPTNKQVITEPAETQHNIAPKITGTGVSWWQKKSWTQLANENNSPFSLSQLLPDISFPEQTAKEPILYPAGSSECKHNGADKNTVDGTVTDGFNLGEIVPGNSEHAGTDDIVSAPVVEKIVETSPRERSANVEIGETCSFMRSADSLKEWKKAKAAVSGSLKRKRSEKK
ncbi:putative RNA recognition motif domain, nucleotide-binding alpha-beta plait domain-containing protein [Medicago truncatula]|uniref:RNA recognition motif n=1 Tax=Medicago truncatula TaxID=3880 RepID=A2Q361_MEDTR|nr:protein REPRESSOR OF SILENCING 3 [Medicago truncatula]ABN08061.1 RNA-binding region RNP-1 (RNA recognition motif); Pyridoxal-dependent decarboxylase [Medicago truncatula]AES65742.1 RNA recognition motif [Medicago truncatula]RHN73892.1 putative RNA recognition motif domain, nucleotide-binding alpha-beta plait domain-containing protein [Medicago truncatula]